MRTVVVPGGFDPVTVGHMDVVERALRLFDEVRVVIFVNSAKKSLFTPVARLEMLRLACAELEERTGCSGRITADLAEGLLADYVTGCGACAVIKGVRCMTDFDYEFQMSLINCEIGGIETVFLPSRGERQFISSTFVREMILYNKPLKGYIPNVLVNKIGDYL